MKQTQFLKVIAYVTGMINRDLLAQNEYLAAENRILRAHLPKRLPLTNAERITLSEIGKRIGRRALASLACVATPETILGWYRRLVAGKFDGSTQRAYPGRPRIHADIGKLIVRLARENPGWGYRRISGALANLGHRISGQTIANILKRSGIAPAPTRSKAILWKDFISTHMSAMCGIDFFTVEVLSWRGLITCYVLFLIELETRRVSIIGITRHPVKEWMEQMARNIGEECNLSGRNYILHDRDTKFCQSFRTILEEKGHVPLRLPPRSPNLNAFAERWVRSVKQECLHKVILFGESSLRRVLPEYTKHYHTERNHQGKRNLILFPGKIPKRSSGSVHCRKRLGGLLRYYSRAA